MTVPPSRIDHALHYAALGIPVMPLHYITQEGICSCGGKEANPRCKPGKHPYGRLVPHGLNDASTDPVKVREWFDGTPFNIGICTGEISRIFALDRDDRDDGECVFHVNLARDSTANRPPVPREPGHRFHGNLAT